MKQVLTAAFVTTTPEDGRRYSLVTHLQFSADTFAINVQALMDHTKFETRTGVPSYSGKSLAYVVTIATSSIPTTSFNNPIRFLVSGEPIVYDDGTIGERLIPIEALATASGSHAVTCLMNIVFNHCLMHGLEKEAAALVRHRLTTFNGKHTFIIQDHKDSKVTTRITADIRNGYAMLGAVTRYTQISVEERHSKRINIKELGLPVELMEPTINKKTLKAMGLTGVVNPWIAVPGEAWTPADNLRVFSDRDITIYLTNHGWSVDPKMRESVYEDMAWLAKALKTMHTRTDVELTTTEGIVGEFKTRVAKVREMMSLKTLVFTLREIGCYIEAAVTGAEEYITYEDLRICVTSPKAVKTGENFEHDLSQCMDTGSFYRLVISQCDLGELTIIDLKTNVVWRSAMKAIWPEKDNVTLEMAVGHLEDRNVKCEFAVNRASVRIGSLTISE